MTKNTDMYQQGIDNLVPRYDIYLSYGGDCGEKWWYSSAIKCELVMVKGGGKKLKIYALFSD